jgi:hypothetical protein
LLSRPPLAVPRVAWPASFMAFACTLCR